MVIDIRDLDDARFAKVIEAIETICRLCNLDYNDWDCLREEITDLIHDYRMEGVKEDEDKTNIL